MKTIYKIVFVGLVALLFSGCATNRGVVALGAPEQGIAVASNGKTIFVKSVKDHRIFEVSPETPNIPSLSPAEVNTPYIQSRAVGRKRNSYGVAMGDVLLQEGNSVERVIQESVEQAFLENGYTVVRNQNDMDSDTIIVDVKINKLWSWMDSNFWSIIIGCEISTDLTIQRSTDSKVEVISVNTSDNFQTGMGANYIQVMRQARELYIDTVKAKVN